MEVSHADLPKVTGVIFVEVRSVVVLTTSHTASTGVLSMFADTAMTGGDVTATVLSKKEEDLAKGVLGRGSWGGRFGGHKGPLSAGGWIRRTVCESLIT